MEIGTVQQVDINKEMRSAYLDYAMSVIVSRALPDARDGLKPVHRRILYGMHQMGSRARSTSKKSARIVGEVLGKYHPHGDTAVYEAMARMAQDFSLRYLMVEGQGNFGSIDGDAPAAMRYTEAKMSNMAEEMLVDIEKETVNFVDNFDGTLQEPVVLPSRLPNLLLNGSSGIAVGMATNIPSHNLNELCSALIYLIDQYENLDEISVEELMEYLPGPDFPTGGIIVGTDGIRQAYSTGRGRIVLRCKSIIEEIRNGRFSIIITEIPYQVNKTTLIERIAELVRKGRIKDISDLRDESDRNGMRIMIELKRGANPQLVLNQLYKYTPLQSTFGVQMLALVGGEPLLLTLKKMLSLFIEHRKEVITRRSQFELEKARRRAHILEGLLKALGNLDEVIKTIRGAMDADEAKTQLMVRFDLTEVQAQAILDLQLRRLAALEQKKIEDEHRETMETIAYLEDLLATPRKILDVIKEDITDIEEKYGDERRTRIAIGMLENLNEEDLVDDEQVLISITDRGYIKRVMSSIYKTQGRGRVGVTGQSVREEDEVVMMLSARTLQTVLFFSDRGKVYAIKAYHIPDAGRTDRGVSIMNVLAMGTGDRITAAVVVPDFDDSRYITLATSKGRMKRMALSEFSRVRPSGLIAINIKDGDHLGWARLTNGEDHIILVTANGQAVRFPETQIRSMGRQAAGVRGIRLGSDDMLRSMDVVEPGGHLLVVTENGFGKRTPLDEYPARSRATKGIKTINQKVLDEIGKIAAARVVQDEDQLTLISSGGVVLRLRVGDIRSIGRASRGVRLMNLTRGGTVASVARIPGSELQEE
jgi:DNA gyrase subunit A